VQEWQVRIPWSRDGLGGSDRFLGTGEEGIPLGGGAFPPAWVLVGPGPQIAVEHFGGTRLYDRQGRFLRELPGSACGFLPDGSIVTMGRLLAAYGPDGSLLWERDPWSEAAKLTGGQGANGFANPPVVSPAGTVYCWMHLNLRDGSLDALLVYGPNGETISCDQVPGSVPLLFTQRSTVFAGAVATERGQAHREFSVDGATFKLVRTIYLPEQRTIYAVGADGSLVARNLGNGESLIEDYTVYRPGAKKAIAFSLPEGHHFAAWTPDGKLYTSQLLEDFFVVTAWTWPVP